MHEKVEFLGLQFFISVIESETTAMSDLVISSLFLINGLATLFDMSDTEFSRWLLSLAYLKANGSQYYPESVDLFTIKRKLYYSLTIDGASVLLHLSPATMFASSHSSFPTLSPEKRKAVFVFPKRQSLFLH